MPANDEKATAKGFMIVHPKDGLMLNGGMWRTLFDAENIMSVLGNAPREKLKQKGWRVAKVWFEEMDNG